MRGLLGGTFDPPHYGHLVLAEEALRRFHLEEVLFVPSRYPPHKHPVLVSDYVHRRAMIEIAVSGNDSFAVADLEPVDGLSYTVDLIERLASAGEKPIFIVGMDSLAEIHSWKDPDRLLELARVVVGTRPGFSARGVGERYLDAVETFPIPGLWISSSELRERFAAGESTRYLIPDEVRSYVLREGLYGTGKGH